MGSQFLNFNVAGHRFTTSKDTILKEPASRLALIARGVLPANRDEAGCIFLDRDPRHFQLVLNYLRDGWCALPKSLEERRELLQEARYYQLAGMEAWVRTQDVLGEAALRPQSPDPYSSSNAALSLNLIPAVGSPGTTQQHMSLSAPGGTAGYAGYSTFSAGPEPAASYAPAAGSLSMRNSFLNGANQDLLAAGTAAAAGIRFSSISPASPAGYTSRSSAAASPEPTAAFSVFGTDTTSSLAYSPLGKTTVSISSECDHDRISGLVGLASGSSDNRFRYQVVRVKSSVGWSFEFSLRPSSDLALYDKYNIAEYVQDNWFVLAACLKDMYGVIMEEDSSAKPNNGACSCTEGYSGAQCEVAPDPCAAVICGAQGTCNGGVCSCSGGYTGSSCEVAPNPCASMSCGAHGSCSNGACSCTDGYSGAQCEVAPDPCANINCGGHGTCSGGSCSCSGGYTGSSCETVACGAHGSCSNGACTCSGDYTGAACDVPPAAEPIPPAASATTQPLPQAPADPCASISCGAGSCTDGRCSCPPGTTGNNCEVTVPEPPPPQPQQQQDPVPSPIIEDPSLPPIIDPTASQQQPQPPPVIEDPPLPPAELPSPQPPAQQPEAPSLEPAAAPVITPSVTNPDPAQQQPAVTPVEPSNAPAGLSTAPVVQPVVPTDSTATPTQGPADLPASAITPPSDSSGSSPSPSPSADAPTPPGAPAGRNRSSSSSPSPAPGDPPNTNSPAPTPIPSTPPPSPEPPADPSQSPPPSPSPRPRRLPRPRPPRPGGNGGHNHDDHYHYDDNTYDDMLYNYDYGGRGGPYNPRGGGYGPYNPYNGPYDPYNSQYDPYNNLYNGRGGYPGYNGYNDYGGGRYPAGGYNPVMGGGYNPYGGGGGYGGGGVPNSGYYNPVSSIVLDQSMADEDSSSSSTAAGQQNVSVLARRTLCKPAKFGFTANWKAQPGFLNCSDTQVPVFAMVTPVNRTQPTGKSPETFKACEGGSRLLSQPVGPFPADACGTYTVTSTLRVRPLTGTPLQPAFSSLATAQLEVTGCPASSSPSNAAAAAAASASAVKVSIANIKATTFYASSWKITASSNVTAGNLVVQQGNAAAVEVVAALSKSAKRTEFAAVSGVVELEGLSSIATALRSVQVTALTRTGQPLLVDAACPADSISADGAIAVPPAPAKLTCSFTIQGMPPTPGVLSALVRIAGAAAPLPVQPAEYAVTPGTSAAGSSKDGNQSSCLKVGPLRNQLVKASKGSGESAAAAAVKGMPVLDVASNFPVGSVCDSLEKTGYTLTFGPFGAKDCGVYAFQSEWQVTGAESAAAAQPLLLERPDIKFAVDVVGCVAGE
ncbi:hypothetical protein OEZ85_007581 [Tetradesmus obliquus]|uniref:EGF-like domain-containing protein n=1 Tax=Tetradesmus obliquus TaxID=3088 RepID=A0ABY8TI94_TETOB|nr:hypothetical protein OEZ85_007581 [Tetradesmus obliquus]